MSESDPGLDLHEWETRWAELDEAFGEDPAAALADACDLVEETLGLAGVADEVEAAYAAARETADAVERGDDVDPGDVGAAIENLLFVRAAVRPAPGE